MDLDAVYIVTEENRSAFWGYKTSDTAEGYRVSYHYGRLGTSPGKPAVKDYGSSHQRSNEISKKVREKLGKDYRLVTMDEYEDQQLIAKELNYQHKIMGVHFVADIKSNGNITYTVGDAYDPDKGVLVEVLNSWSKETFLVWLNKNASRVSSSAKIINGVAIMTTALAPPSGWVNAIKRVLAKVAKVVQEARATLSSSRVIYLGEDAEPSIEETNKVASYVSSAGTVSNIVANDVVTKFASLGGRVLVL